LFYANIRSVSPFFFYFFASWKFRLNAGCTGLLTNETNCDRVYEFSKVFMKWRSPLISAVTYCVLHVPHYLICIAWSVWKHWVRRAWDFCKWRYSFRVECCWWIGSLKHADVGVLHSGNKIATWFVRHVHVSTIHFVRQGKWAKNTGLFFWYEFCGTAVVTVYRSRNE
jgi:hypothetical protein